MAGDEEHCLFLALPLTFCQRPMPSPVVLLQVMRQAFHQAVQGLPSAAVVANTDMGTDNGRVRHCLCLLCSTAVRGQDTAFPCGHQVRNGLPSGAMHRCVAAKAFLLCLCCL